MKKLMLLVIPTLLIIVLFLLQYDSYEDYNYEINEKVEIEVIYELGKYEEHHFVNFSNNYLCYFNPHEEQVVVHNITTNNRIKHDITRGAGPDDIDRINGLACDEDGSAYILDPGNAKILKITREGTFRKEERLSGVMYHRLYSKDDKLFSLSVNSEDPILIKTTDDEENYEYEPLARENPILKEGK